MWILMMTKLRSIIILNDDYDVWALSSSSSSTAPLASQPAVMCGDGPRLRHWFWMYCMCRGITAVLVVPVVGIQTRFGFRAFIRNFLYTFLSGIILPQMIRPASYKWRTTDSLIVVVPAHGPGYSSPFKFSSFWCLTAIYKIYLCSLPPPLFIVGVRLVGRSVGLSIYKRPCF